MKRCKNLGFLFICLICLSIFVPANVFAAECTQARAEDTYNPQYIRNTSNHTITVKVDSGVFDVRVEGTIEHTGSVSQNQSFTFSYNNNVDHRFNIYLTLSQPDDLCTLDNNISFTKTFEFTSNTVDLYTNTSLNTVCQAFKTGTGYNEYFSRTGISRSSYERLNYAAVAGNREARNFYESNLDYCWQSRVQTNYSESVVASLITTVMLRWNTSHNISRPIVTPNSSYTFVENDNVEFFGDDNRSTIKSLKCDPWKVVDSYDNDSEYYVNQNKYYTTSSSEENFNGYVCQTNCQEEIIIEYGPPVASKAGLCFEYKVKVQSKVTCTGTLLGDQPNRSDYAVCTNVSSSCNSDDTLYDQGGPNEDFDSCIDDCDSGKYTQKCINKCYKQVYGNSNIKMALDYSDKYTVSQLGITNVSNSCGTYKNNSPRDPNPRDAVTVRGVNVEGVLNEMATYDAYGVIQNYKGSGKYVWENGKVVWKSNSNCYWDRLGAHYFSNKNRALQAIYNINNQDYGSFRGRVYQFVCSDGHRTDRSAVCDSHGGRVSTEYLYYDARSDGFLVAEGCEDDCEWIVRDRNGNIATQATCPYLNQSDADTAYQEALNRYNSALAECTGRASCSTSTSEFTIQVNNKTTERPNRDNWIPNSPWKATLVGNTKNDSDNIILNKGGECFGGATTTSYDYMTEWSFPGTWINNKTGEISYSTPSRTNEWHEKKNKFCTSLKSSDVNTKWWNWKMHNNYQACSVTSMDAVTKESILAQVNSNLNIKATARNFGKFDWDFNIGCFYALNSKPGSYTETETGPEIEEPIECPIDDCDSRIETCDKVSVDNYKFRNVTTSDLFPGEDASTTDTGRDPGFNWSHKATNLNNSQYEVTPTALIKTIQDRQNQIYNEDNENKYLDYEFVLDSSTIKEIRDYNINEGKNNYTNYRGTTYNVNGITVYKSTMFRDPNGILYNSNNVLGKLGCNNQEGNSCEIFNDDYVEALRGSR